MLKNKIQMNRQINFKGLTSGSSKWVFGDLIQLDNDTLIAGNDMAAGEFKNGHIELSAIPINPDTVGQFTGLLDKNNNPIYEGDVVRVGNKVAAVTFEKGCFYTKHNNSNYRLGGWKDNTIEIIGNIYQNPELLSTQ